MVTRADIPFLLAPFGSVQAFAHVARMITRHFTDRLRYRRGTNLVMGNALVAQLLSSLRKQGTPIPTNDMWLAALVLQHNLALHARDKHFEHLPQLVRV